MLQAVSVTLRGGDVQQVVPVFVSDQLQVVSSEVWLEEEEGQTSSGVFMTFQ